MSAARPDGAAGGSPPPVPGAVPARRAAPSPLRLYPNPVRQALSASTWRAASFLAVYVFVAGWLLFAVAFTATVTAAVFLITLAGIPLLVGAAGVLHGCAATERARLRSVLAGPVAGGYRQVTGRGIMAQVRTRWRDPATWREVAYLIGLWPLLFGLDTVVLTVWLTLLAGVTLPAWYWAPRGNVGLSYTAGGVPVHGVALGYFPHGPNGPGCLGSLRGHPAPGLRRRGLLPGRVPALQLRARGHGPRSRPHRGRPAARARRPARAGQGGAHPPGPAGPAARCSLRPAR